MAACVICLYGQTSFRLEKERVHYYFSDTVSGHADTRLFADTGVSGMVMGRDDFDRLFVNVPLDTMSTTVKSGLGVVVLDCCVEALMRPKEIMIVS